MEVLESGVPKSLVSISAVFLLRLYAASTHGRKQKSKCLHARGAGHRHDLALPQPALVVANLVLSINPS